MWHWILRGLVGTDLEDFVGSWLVSKTGDRELLFPYTFRRSFSGLAWIL